MKRLAIAGLVALGCSKAPAAKPPLLDIPEPGEVEHAARKSRPENCHMIIGDSLSFSFIDNGRKNTYTYYGDVDGLVALTIDGMSSGYHTNESLDFGGTTVKFYLQHPDLRIEFPDGCPDWSYQVLSVRTSKIALDSYVDPYGKVTAITEDGVEFGLQYMGFGSDYLTGNVTSKVMNVNGEIVLERREPKEINLKE